MLFVVLMWALYPILAGKLWGKWGVIAALAAEFLIILSGILSGN